MQLKSAQLMTAGGALSVRAFSSQAEPGLREATHQAKEMQTRFRFNQNLQRQKAASGKR
jgi:hypothetical protein